MKPDEVKELFLYSEWANKKYLDAIKNLSEEKYSFQVKSSFKSIRETMAHIISSEWIWLQRWNGINPGAPPDWLDNPSIETLEEKFNSVISERKKFLDTLNDDSLEQVMSYNLLSGKASQNSFKEMFQHIINHSTYHRGQLATLFRQVDEVPPSTDLILFYREKNGLV